MSRSRGVLAAAVCLLALAACGGRGAAGAHASPSPPPLPMAQASWGDNAHQVSLAQGQELKVELTGSSCNPTSVPVASAPSVLKVDAVGKDSQGGAWARFHARTPGTSTVTAVNSPGCGGSTSGEASYGFSLTVSVR